MIDIWKNSMPEIIPVISFFINVISPENMTQITLNNTFLLFESYLDFYK